MYICSFWEHLNKQQNTDPFFSKQKLVDQMWKMMMMTHNVKYPVMQISEEDLSRMAFYLNAFEVFIPLLLLPVGFFTGSLDTHDPESCRIGLFPCHHQAFDILVKCLSLFVVSQPGPKYFYSVLCRIAIIVWRRLTVYCGLWVRPSDNVAIAYHQDGPRFEMEWGQSWRSHLHL